MVIERIRQLNMKDNSEVLRDKLKIEFNVKRKNDVDTNSEIWEA